MDEVNYIVGMLLKDRRNKPTAIFLIKEIYTRHYKNGESATRVVGYVSSDEEFDYEQEPAIEIGERDLDSRSVAIMFPYVWFNPYIQRPIEDK